MTTSAFGQLLDRGPEPQMEGPAEFKMNISKNIFLDLSKYKKLTLQGVGQVFIAEDLGKLRFKKFGRLRLDQKFEKKKDFRKLRLDQKFEIKK
jgi:hypothetical protein